MNPTPLTRLQVSTPTETTIVLTRTFNAPRRLVWEAMFTPDRMRRWTLPPPRWTMAVCGCEAGVGGVLRLVPRSEEADQVLTPQGVFTEVVPHQRAVHTETMVSGSGETIGTLVETHELAEKGGVPHRCLVRRALGRQPTWRSGAARACGRFAHSPCREVPYDPYAQEEACRGPGASGARGHREGWARADWEKRRHGAGAIASFGPRASTSGTLLSRT